MTLDPRRATLLAALALLPCFAVSVRAQESLPSQVAGTWRIVRVLPTRNTGCWEAAGTLVGTTLTYRTAAMRWHGGEISLNGVVTRTLTADTFEKETAATWGTPLHLADLNIQSPQVLEVNLQHEDADITGASTEVPGDSILLAGRNTIVISACGSFFEAMRVSSATPHPVNQSTQADSALKPTNRLNTSFQKK